MRALVVVESMFGNSRIVAEAIAEGLRTRCDTTVVDVGDAPLNVADVDLLVVGGPTHAFGMSRPATRREAAGQAPERDVKADVGIREWIAVVDLAHGPAVATFDTRAARHRLTGSAARAAQKLMRKAGAHAVARPTSFFVTGVQGPLADGEVARARQLGATLAGTGARMAA